MIFTLKILVVFLYNILGNFLYENLSSSKKSCNENVTLSLIQSKRLTVPFIIKRKINFLLFSENLYKQNLDMSTCRW